jgi:hypothetical protein
LVTDAHEQRDGRLLRIEMGESAFEIESFASRFANPSQAALDRRLR